MIPGSSSNIVILSHRPHFLWWKIPTFTRTVPVFPVFLEEQNKRLQLELELENLKRNEYGGIFSKSEQEDFNFIWNKFDRLERVSFSRVEKKSQKILDENFCEIEINIQPILSIISGFSEFEFNKFVSYNLLRIIIGEIFPEERNNLNAYKILISSEELLKFGLLVKSSKTEGSFSDNKVHTRNICIPSDKMRRFEYWLEYTGKMPKELKYRLFKKNQDPIELTCSIENIREKRG